MGFSRFPLGLLAAGTLSMRKRAHEAGLSLADYGRMLGALRLLREIEEFGVRLTNERTERPPLSAEEKRNKRQRYRSNLRARQAFEAAQASQPV